MIPTDDAVMAMMSSIGDAGTMIAIAVVLLIAIAMIGDGNG